MPDMARVVDERTVDVPIDGQGRVVIPRSLRSALGAVPGVIRARRVEGGILLEHPVDGEVSVGDDGLPIVLLGRPISNDESLAAIDAERAER